MPLRHAWAITVHKSQGMSLDEAVIDLSRSFTYGMGYVALSRVRRLEGLHLIGFSRESLDLDPRMYMVDQDLQKRSERAAERLKEIDLDTLEKRHADFITKSGGSLEIKVQSVKNKLSTQKTHEQTYDLIKSGKTIDDVAKERDLVIGTVIDHLDKARQLGWDISFKHVKPSKVEMSTIKAAFQETKERGTDIHEAKLTPVKRYLDKAGADYSFDTIKLVRLFLK
jgi:transposase